MIEKHLQAALRADWDEHLPLVAHVAAAVRRDVNPDMLVAFAIQIVAEAVVQLGRGDLEQAVADAMAKKRDPHANP